MKEVFGPVTGFKILEGPPDAPNRLDLKIDYCGIEQSTLNGLRWEKTLHSFDQVHAVAENGNLVLTLSGECYVLQTKNPENFIRKINEVQAKARDYEHNKKQPSFGRWLLGLLFIIGLISTIGLIADQPSKSANTDAKDITVEVSSLVQQTFGGKIRDDKSAGIVSVNHTQEINIPNEEPIPALTLINYRYKPVGVRSLKKEVGTIVSRKLHDLYASSSEFNHVRMTVYLPFIDVYGHQSWEHAAFIVMTRATYEKIDWENFMGENLWIVADEASRENWIEWD